MAFESAIYTVSEDAGSVTVCAMIRGETAGEEIHLSLFTQDNTAKGTPKSNFQNVAKLRLTPMSHILQIWASACLAGQVAQWFQSDTESEKELIWIAFLAINLQ